MRALTRVLLCLFLAPSAFAAPLPSVVCKASEQRAYHYSAEFRQAMVKHEAGRRIFGQLTTLTEDLAHFVDRDDSRPGRYATLDFERKEFLGKAGIFATLKFCDPRACQVFFQDLDCA